MSFCHSAYAFTIPLTPMVTGVYKLVIRSITTVQITTTTLVQSYVYACNEGEQKIFVHSKNFLYRISFRINWSNSANFHRTNTTAVYLPTELQFPNDRLSTRLYLASKLFVPARLHLASKFLVPTRFHMAAVLHIPTSANATDRTYSTM